MHLRQVKIGCRIAGATLLALGGCVFLGCLLWPCADSPEADPTPIVSNTRRDVKPPAPAVPSLEQFRAVWHKPLQRPLFDPPPAKKAATAVEKQIVSPLKIKLIGTMVELAQPAAMFVVPGGVVEVKQIGEMVDNAPGEAEVLAIEADQVTLLYQGDTIPLVIEDRKDAGSR